MATKDGEKIEKTINASSRDEAFKIMNAEGFTDISIVEKTSFFERRAVRTKDLSIMFRQLAAFAASGETIPKALANVADCVTNPLLKDAILDIKMRVDTGESLPSAFSHYSFFPKIVVNLLKVGDASGEMEMTLDELAKYLQQMDEINEGVNSAMMYPKIILFVMSCALLYVVTNVLPQFRAFYTDMHIEMPFVTQCLYAVSDFMNDDWMIVLPALAAIVYFLKNTKKYIPDIHDNLCITLPIIKRIMINLYMFRFCKTMQILVSSNVEILQSLALTADVLENHLYADIIKQTIPYVKNGESISSSMRKFDKDKRFDNMATAYLSTGEDTSNIDGLMGQAASYYQKNLQREIDNFSKEIEPILLIVIGFFVLIMVSAIYLPIFRMGQMVS